MILVIEHRAGVRQQGFTLVEIAIVMIVVGYLLSQMIAPFGAQRVQAMRVHTAQQLAAVLDATTGFAIARHRLPCPAGAETNGMERTSCHGPDAVGFVPAATLGISGPVDAQGRLLDSWGRPLVYAVSRSDHPARGEQGKPDFITEGEMGNVGLPYLRSDLQVCRQARAGTCSRANVRANQVPVVVLSLGPDSSSAGQQAHNQDSDSLFVSRPASRRDDLRFDDIVLWLSESRLILEMVRAGTL